MSLTGQWQYLRQSLWELVKAENHSLIILVMDIPLMDKCHLPQSMTKIYGQNFKKNVIDHGQWQKNCHLLKGIYPHLELSHILPSCLTENVSKQRGAPIICIYREYSQVSVKFCICTWFAPNFPQVQYGGEELTEKGSKFAISKWTNTGFPNEQIHFFQAYKYKYTDISEWVPISASTPAPPWYNGKVTHSAPQHPTTPHCSPSPKNADIHRII